MTIEVGGLYLTKNGEKVVITEYSGTTAYRGYIVGRRGIFTWNMLGRNLTTPLDSEARGHRREEFNLLFFD